MKKIIAAASISLLAAACGDFVDNRGCDLTKFSGLASVEPDEGTRAKALELLKKAEESRAQKDFAACEAYKKEAQELIGLTL